MKSWTLQTVIKLESGVAFQYCVCVCLPLDLPESLVKSVATENRSSVRMLSEHRCPFVSVMSPMVLGVWIISWPSFTEQVGRNQSPDPTKGSVCPEQCQSLVDPFLPKCLEKQPVAHVHWDIVGRPSWRCQTLFSTCRELSPKKL